MNKFIDELKNKITIPDEHYYQSSKSGNWLPSVTHILDCYPKGYGFILWLKQVGMSASEILNEAAEIGSNVHAAIDQYVKSGELSYLSKEGKELYKWEEWELICRAMEFFEVFKPEILVHEFSFANDELGYGGTIDMVCKINDPTLGELIWLIDYKSGNNVYESHYLQIAAYAEAWNKLNSDYKIQRCGILHLKASTQKQIDGKYQGKGWKLEESKNSIDNDFEYFQYTHKLWIRTNPNAKPKIQEYPLSFKKEVK